MINRTLLFTLFLCSPTISLLAAESNVKLDPVNIDLSDTASLRRGAITFVNYCLSCHSARYMRYNRVGTDLDIPEETIKQNFLFAGDKVGDLMKAVMPADDAKEWFGIAPPDLTLIGRRTDPEWIYTYLRGFYPDDNSPSGWNNVIFENVAMPHVLYEWQGHQKPVYREEIEITVIEDADGNTEAVETVHEVFDHFEVVQPGSKSVEEFDNDIRDLVNFFVYLGEPVKLHRHRIGRNIELFLLLLLISAVLLKREYWKDVN